MLEGGYVFDFIVVIILRKGFYIKKLRRLGVFKNVYFFFVIVVFILG